MFIPELNYGELFVNSVAACTIPLLTPKTINPIPYFAGSDLVKNYLDFFDVSSTTIGCQSTCEIDGATCAINPTGVTIISSSPMKI